MNNTSWEGMGSCVSKTLLLENVGSFLVNPARGSR